MLKSPAPILASVLTPRFALSAVLLLAMSCASGDANRTAAGDSPPARFFTLLYTASLLGQLEPCGCSPDMRGGIARAATIVEGVRAEGARTLLIDGGDRFFSDDEPTDPIAREQERLRTKTLASITRAMKYDAVVLGNRDAHRLNDADSGDFDFGDLDRLPLLAPSATPGKGRQAARLHEVGAVRVGLFAVDPIDSVRPAEARDVEEGDERLMFERARELRARGAHVIIAIVHLPFSETRELAPFAADAGVDLLFASRSDHPLTDESGADPWSVPPVFTLRPRGEDLLRIDIAPGEAGTRLVPVPGVEARQEELSAISERIRLLQREIMALPPGDPMRTARTGKVLELQERTSAIASAPPPVLPAGTSAFTWAFIPIASRIPERPDVRAMLDEHDRRVVERSLELAGARPTSCPEPGEGEAVYVGDVVCATCHRDAMAFWKTTSHSGAWRTLVDRNKHVSTRCVSCHVTGFGQPGGACDVVATDGRRNVQCEACHGPGSLHVTTTSGRHIVARPDESVCTTCHDPANSPHFSFPGYLEKILGPGHGAAVRAAVPKPDDVAAVAYD